MTQSKQQPAAHGIELKNVGGLKKALTGGVGADETTVPEALRESVLGRGNDRPRKKPKRKTKQPIQNPAQFNVATDQRNKDRAAMIKARDRKSYHQILTEALDLYEKKYGAVTLPDA